MHWITNAAALDGNGTVKAVGPSNLIAYTFEECLNYCTQYNGGLGNVVDPKVPGSGCLAVTFNGDIEHAIQQFNQTCFLKDRQGVYDSAQNTTESAILISF